MSPPDDPHHALRAAIARYDADPGPGTLAAVAQAAAAVDGPTALEILTAVPATVDRGPLWVLAGELAVRSGHFDRAIPILRRAARLDRTWQTWHLLGIALRETGDTDGALEAFTTAVALDPAADPPHQDLIRTALSLGPDRLLTVYRDLAEAHPTSGPILARFGGVLLKKGHRDEARAVLQRALTVDGGNVPAMLALATLHQQEGRSTLALHHLRRAWTQAPGDRHIALTYGNALMDAGQVEQAVPVAHRLVAEHPTFVKGLLLRALLHRYVGETDAYLETLERAVAIAPDDAEATGLLQAAREMAGNRLEDLDGDHPAMVIARSVAARTPEERRRAIAELKDRMLPDSSFARFHIAQHLDKLGEYDEAFRWVQEANAPRRPHRRILEMRDDLVDRLLATFSPDWFPGAPRSTVASRRPIFVLGMPRSGTSLMEQMLQAHPDIAPGGELPLMHRLTREAIRLGGASVPWPEVVRHLDVGALTRLGRAYLDATDEAAGDLPRLTDKMPHNFLAVGLIALVLPHAAILHMRRDPRDTCLSILFQNFASFHPYSWDMVDIAEEYGRYRRLMEHWEALGIPMVDVAYEDLVVDPEPTLRRVLDAIGVPWDPAVLAFHASKNVVATASYQQVREPLYRSSLGRWKNYEKHLGPMLEALGEYTA